ncbi:hypothetical protein E8E13_006717 [Curvularia kusanoi]|uniref:Uncharacterized protein n=1 Tax=Curvularia kusanoi TaxID=90978 RepID=A0A9P4TA38_CURKU|nr:hypothetical protein E8E13_006717 [Curvularia kusanoi]
MLEYQESNNSSESEEVRPFVIPAEDVEVLNASEGFCMLRNYLARDTSFCPSHNTCDPPTQQTWILQRDLLHALVAPVLALFTRASTLACAALCSSRASDLELAFGGDARGAFLCLQCFVDEEEDWCRTRGCPACVVSETLSTESHLRLTIAASLLSTAGVGAGSGGQGEGVEEGDEGQDDGQGQPSLPPLPHILPALRDALASDPFWGPDHWPYLLSRAAGLSKGIQALIKECADLEALVSSPSSSSPLSNSSRSAAPSVQRFSSHTAETEPKGARLKKSKLAKRQLRLEKEELELMRRVAAQCWARTCMTKRVRGELLGAVRGPGEEASRRRRSLTCP